jgi:hypothetical protein
MLPAQVPKCHDFAEFLQWFQQFKINGYVPMVVDSPPRMLKPFNSSKNCCGKTVPEQLHASC